MDEQKGSTIILFDIENIYWYGARKDTALKDHSNSQILKAVIASIDKYTASLGDEDALRFAAFSLNEPYDDKEDKIASGQHIFKTSAILVDSGWTVLLVPHAQNAADMALVNVSEASLVDAHINNVVIVTGDGGEPYASLVRHSLDNGKTVHVLVYDSIPLEVRDRQDVVSLTIFGSVQEFLCERSFSLQGGNRKMKPEEELRQCVRAFCLNPGDEKILKHRREFLKNAVRMFGTQFKNRRDSQKTDFYHMLNLISQNVLPGLEKNYPVPGPEDLKLILSALIDCSDLFERRKILRFNPKSKLLQALS